MWWTPGRPLAVGGPSKKMKGRSAVAAVEGPPDGAGLLPPAPDPFFEGRKGDPGIDLVKRHLALHFQLQNSSSYRTLPGAERFRRLASGDRIKKTSSPAGDEVIITPRYHPAWPPGHPPPGWRLAKRRKARSSGCNHTRAPDNGGPVRPRLLVWSARRAGWARPASTPLTFRRRLGKDLRPLPAARSQRPRALCAPGSGLLVSVCAVYGDSRAASVRMSTGTWRMNPEAIERVLAEILPRVQKPARYTGGELNSVVKSWTERRAERSEGAAQGQPGPDLPGPLRHRDVQPGPADPVRDRQPGPALPLRAGLRPLDGHGGGAAPLRHAPLRAGDEARPGGLPPAGVLPGLRALLQQRAEHPRPGRGAPAGQRAGGGRSDRPRRGQQHHQPGAPGGLRRPVPDRRGGRGDHRAAGDVRRPAGRRPEGAPGGLPARRRRDRGGVRPLPLPRAVPSGRDGGRRRPAARGPRPAGQEAGGGHGGLPLPGAARGALRGDGARPRGRSRSCAAAGGAAASARRT